MTQTTPQQPDDGGAARDMSLRDTFATHAMQAMVAGHRKTNRDPRRKGGDEPLLDYTSPDCEGVTEDSESNARIIAQTAYEVADAMLAARTTPAAKKEENQ